MRWQLLSEVAREVGRINVDLFIITHILPDRPQLLEALELVGTVSRVIAIPYSVDPETLRLMRGRYDILTPSLEELQSAQYIGDALVGARSDKPLVALEIGGYLAKTLPKVMDAMGESFLGVIEDTEAGHRLYANASPLPCPVVSIARSRIKESEDALVGLSCVFTTDRLLRGLDLLLESRIAPVIGYGRVGRGTALALRNRHCQTFVFDSNPVQQVLAMADGFGVPERRSSLGAADVVFGATGNRSLAGEDFSILKDGCILVSCSSRDLEFDLEVLNDRYEVQALTDEIALYTQPNRTLILLGGGRPVNFLDAAVIGPVLALPQAGLITAIGELWTSRHVKGLRGLSADAQERLAAHWLAVFRHPMTGLYRTS